jgi:hypothetical protein
MLKIKKTDNNSQILQVHHLYFQDISCNKFNPPKLTLFQDLQTINQKVNQSLMLTGLTQKIIKKVIKLSVKKIYIHNMLESILYNNKKLTPIELNFLILMLPKRQHK